MADDIEDKQYYTYSGLNRRYIKPDKGVYTNIDAPCPVLMKVVGGLGPTAWYQLCATLNVKVPYSL